MPPARCFVLAAALLPCPAWAEERPSWVSGADGDYPKSSYIAGVGEGPTQEKAADKARAEVAKSFGVALTASTLVSARETGSGSSSSFSQEVSDEVRTSTRKVLEGVEIARYWRASDGAHYALAVLERVKALAMLKDKLAESDASFKDWTSQMQKAEGKFGRLRAALQLVRLARLRRKLNADYRVLNPEGRGLPPPETDSETLARARKAVAALRVQVGADGEEGRRVANRIIDGLSTYGLRAVEKGEQGADLLIEARAEGERLPPENLMWFWARGNILVKMSYGNTGEVFTRFEESGQEAARDPGSSLDAVLTRLADRAAGRIYDVVLNTDLSDE